MSLYAQRDKKLSLKEMVIFSMFATLMLISKKLLEWAPNIHLLGMFTILLTVSYRKKALIPLYLYVFLNGLIEGFSLWWMPYLYIWTILWGITMLLPKDLKPKYAVFVYPLICGLHGFAYGALYSPAQALMYGFDFNTALAWIAAGIPFDIIHGIGNLAAGTLVLPLKKAVDRLK